MKRVYTDPRFPNFEVANDGDNVFHVIINGEAQDQFVASEDITREEVSDDFAQRQAQEYFEYLASRQGGDDGWQQDFTGGGTALAEPKPRRKLGVKHEPGEQPVDDGDVFNNPPSSDGSCRVCKGSGTLDNGGTEITCQRCGGSGVENQGARSGGKSLDDMFPEGELVTQDTVDRLIAAARAETDPARRAQLRQQALSAMQQMESLARHVVRVMLS